MPITVHSARHTTPTGKLGAMTPSKRTVNRARHAGGGRRLRPFRAGAVLVHVAGRVAGPVAGEDGGAHRELRRVLGARRRAETDARSIV
jgi:hypothetical protein